MCLYKLNWVYSENGTKTTDGSVTFVGGDEGRKNNSALSFSVTRVSRCIADGDGNW